MGAVETLTTRSILQLLNTLGVGYKIHSSGMQGKGTPDIAGVVKGRAIFLEVKTDTGVASPAQKYQLARLKQAGAICGIVRNRAEVQALLQAHGLSGEDPT